MKSVNSLSLLLLPLTFLLVQGNLVKLAHQKYSSSADNCDFQNEPCAPLSDVWGYSVEERELAIVGMSNGVDFWDVSNPHQPRRPGSTSFFQGCITEWRDIKVRGTTAYVVHDYTTLCSCEKQPCQFYAKIVEPTSAKIPASEGRITVPLDSLESGVTGEVALYSFNEANLACDEEDVNPNLDGKIAMLNRGGNCMFSTKILNAQKHGAIAVVVVNDRPDIIYPSMGGNSTGVNIPGVMIGLESGEQITELMNKGSAVKLQLKADQMMNSDLYGPPEGLWLLDLRNPDEIRSVIKTREWFSTAHNILIDTDPTRPYAYVCGMDTHNGGLLVLDISDPLNPVAVGTWEKAYFHDIEVEKRPDGNWVLYGAAIYDGLVYILDVNDPAAVTNSSTIFSFKTGRDSPHNSAATSDGTYLYVTHEDAAMPVTIWDVTSFDHVKKVGELSINIQNETIPHNAFIKDNLLWLSYYSEGVVVYDIKHPAKPKLLGHLDTSVYTNGFHGVWGVYPFSEHEETIAYASDIENGLWVMELESSKSDKGDDSKSGDKTDNDKTGDSDSGKPFYSRILEDRQLQIMIGAGACVVLVVIVAAVIIRRRRRGGAGSPEAEPHELLGADDGLMELDDLEDVDVFDESPDDLDDDLDDL